MINGSINTVDAIGIHEGKVVATGTKASVESYMATHGIKYTSKELSAQQALLPGLVEPHVHIVPTALLKGWLDLSGLNGQIVRDGYDKDWVKQTIKEHKKQNLIKYELGGWILAKEIDPSLMPFTVNTSKNGLNELVTLDCEQLDEWENDSPLMILSASMHTLYLNKKALKKVFESSADVQKEYKTFDEYRLKTKGQLQEEAGMSPAFEAIPKAQMIEMVLGCFKHLTELFDEATSRGATFMYDAGMTDNLKNLLDIYLLFHQKKVRIGAAKICSSLDEAKSLTDFQAPTSYKDVYYGNVKLVSDGSNQGLTGYQSVPYCCEPKDNLGIFDFTEKDNPTPTTMPAVYKDIVHKVFVEKGWPIMIHANGDRAIDFAIEVFDDVITKTVDTTRRNRIEHCSILTP